MKIHHIAITVNSLEESLKFYQDFFNFKINKSFERKDLGAKVIFLELGDLFLELWGFADFKNNDGDLKDKKIIGIRHIAFEVENLDKIFSDFKQRGLEMTEPKLGASGRMYSFISDPSGIPIELYQLS